MLGIQNKCLWQPDEIIDLGQDCKCGITTDDGCYMVLLPNQTGFWKPTNWIPLKAAIRIGELATAYCKKCSV